MKQFAGRGVVVTGASQGIGHAVAEAFLAEGAGVVLVGRDASRLEEAQRILDPDASRTAAIAADVSQRTGMHRAVQRCIKQFGGIHAVVGSAGTYEYARFLDLDAVGWKRIVDKNLLGAFFTVQEAARAMLPRGGGAIVIIASTNAFQPEQGSAAYNVAKSGQVAIVKTAAMELASQGIRVNAIDPGIIATPMARFLLENPPSAKVMRDRIPMGRFGQPNEIAQAVLFLCSEAASYLTGHELIVDGGMTAGVTLPVAS